METTTFNPESAGWTQAPSAERLSSFVTSRLARLELLDDADLELN